MPSCGHFLVKKGRPCGQPTPGDDPVCGPHSASYSASCTECGTRLHPRSVSKHLSKCPRVRADASLYSSKCFSKFVNRPALTVTNPQQSLTFEEAVAFLKSVAEPVDEIPCLSKQEMDEFLDIKARWAHPRTSYARLEARHFVQVAALASLALTDTIGDGLTISELGAGRAYTSLFLAETLKMRGKKANFLAVDRGANRNKMDGVLRAMTERGGVIQFNRLRVDIAHLQLQGVEELVTAENPRIIGKHLCGAAADAALRAVDEFCERWRAGRSAGECRVIIAPCCRSVCEWDALHSIADIWTSSWGIGKEVFDLIYNRASWGLNPGELDAEKVRAGCVCRNAVDGARVKWLKSRGWNARLVRYVALDVTTENVAIVAQWRIIQEETSLADSRFN